MTGPTAYRTVPTHASANATDARADLPATDAQALANPKVRALVKAALSLSTEWAEHLDDQKHYLVVNAGGVAWQRFQAALAAMEKDRTE